MSTISIFTGALALALLGYAAKALLFTKRQLPLPPGPKPYPIIGNFLNNAPPGTPDYEHWLKRKEVDGPITSATTAGLTLIVIQDLDLAIEMLDKRGATYSSRPKIQFAGEMCGWSETITLMPYGERMRESRKQLHSVIGTKAAVERFSQLQEVEANRFLFRLLETPKEFRQHIRTEAAAAILKMAYGYTVQPRGVDPLVQDAERVLENFTKQFAQPGAIAVEFVPWLKYLPTWLEWLPGMGFKKTAREWRAGIEELVKRPWEFAKADMKDNGGHESFVSGLFEKNGGRMTESEEYVAKWNATTLYLGGADTTVSTLASFFLAMTLNPSVQRTAQAEIDTVIGTDRLPVASDRESLPFIEALVTEVFRWLAIVPMGLPHNTTKEDIVSTSQGTYRIPKGAMAFANLWHFTRDWTVYPDPDKFNPSRFLGETPAPDPRNFVFGFGRRICPGKMFADAAVWLTIAKVLAAFDIGKAVDAEGNVIEPRIETTMAIPRHPVPFECSIVPRSEKSEELIREFERGCLWEEGSKEALERVNGRG